jgi:2'-5' RNA ligase
MIEKMRSFVAIEIPEGLRQKLRELLRGLKSTGADVKWVRPEGMHLTLKFLGDADRETLESLSLSLGPVVEKFSPFEIQAQGVGGFPSFRSPRVIWAGLIEPRGVLSALQREIESTTAGFGFPPEGRPFNPHLTLGRVRSSEGKGALARTLEEKAAVDLGAFRPEHVTLFRSDLRAEGAVYTRIKEFHLQGL